MSSVQAAVERVLLERTLSEQLPDCAEGGPAYTDTPASTGEGPRFSPERCGLPSSRTSDELVRFMLAQPTPTRSRRASVRPSHVHHLLILDLSRITRRP